MGIENLTFNYAEELYWDKEQFNQQYKIYSKDKTKYLKDFVKNFSIKFLKSNLKATDWSVSFKSQYEMKTDKLTYSTLIQCRINGAATGRAQNPYFRTEWLLIPILGNRVDLYGFKYITDKVLAYRGKVNHIPITIVIRSPKPISHCHYHIWYK